MAMFIRHWIVGLLFKLQTNNLYVFNYKAIAGCCDEYKQGLSSRSVEDI
jgi:hypothetical protein